MTTQQAIAMAFLAIPAVIVWVFAYVLTKWLGKAKMRTKHPDEEIIKEYREDMNRLAAMLDKFLNGDAKGKARKTCFVLLVAPFGDSEGRRTNYISNGNRPDIVTLMKEMIARFEGQAEASGRA